MLQILKKEGVEGYEEALEELGLSGSPNIKISEAVSSGKVDGYGIYEITPEEIKVYSLRCGGDLVLADGLIRSILFLAALKGVEKAEFLNGAEELAQRLKMIQPESNILEPISDIFGGCEDCKKSK